VVASQDIEHAIAITLAENGPKTPDLGGTATTEEVGKAIAERIATSKPMEISRGRK
jgi:isocitrate/isopropylmalate dehydrogenase